MLTEQEQEIHFLSMASQIASKYGVTIEIGDKAWNPEFKCWDNTINFVGDYDPITGQEMAFEITNILGEYAV